MAGDFEQQVFNAREKFNLIKNEKDDENNLYDDRDDKLGKLYWEVNKISASLVSVWFKEHSTLTKDIKISLELLLNDIKNEIPKLSPEQIKKMKTISSIEFLTLPESERLEYVTSPNKKSSDINKNDNITFNFTFEWKKNNNLYMLTTVWQILPKEVRSVSKEGLEYERNGLKWEFYNWNKRLIINDKTDISIIKIWTEAEFQEIDAKNQIKYDNFLEDNKEFKDEKKYENTIKETIDKGITDFDQIKFLLTWNIAFLDKFKPEELEKLLTVSTYLKNAWFLDNAWVDAKDLISDLKGYWITWKVDEDWNMNYDLSKLKIPEWITENVRPFIEKAISQLWVKEFDKWPKWADRYFEWYGKWLNSRNTPWCAAFVNWTLNNTPWFKWNGNLAAKSFIKDYSIPGHVWIKIWDQLLWWNQGNRVSLKKFTTNKIEWYVMPNDLETVHRNNYNNIPDGAIVVYDSSINDKKTR